MLRYGYLGVGLGGVGWGNNVHVNLHTHVLLSYGFVCGCVVDIFCNGIQHLIRCLCRDSGMVRPREDINSLHWDTTPDKMSLQGLGNGEAPGRH